MIFMLLTYTIFEAPDSETSFAEKTVFSFLFMVAFFYMIFYRFLIVIYLTIRPRCCAKNRKGIALDHIHNYVIPQQQQTNFPINRPMSPPPVPGRFPFQYPYTNPTNHPYY
jgi:hypothetical protein